MHIKKKKEEEELPEIVCARNLLLGFAVVFHFRFRFCVFFWLLLLFFFCSFVCLLFFCFVMIMHYNY